MIVQNLINKLIERRDMTLTQSMNLMEMMLEGVLTQSQIASVLTALRMKGEIKEEILGFIKVMRNHMLKVKTKGVVIDTCGTGGDGKGTFNISTTTALVVAGAGVAVAKHGNRSASSLYGSADVLEALGVKIDLSPQQAEEMIKRIGFTFLFAPLYHPAMKFVAPVRKELGFRTVFNFLGPFVSPATVRRQIIGVPNIQLAEKLAKVAINLDYEHLLLISSEDGLDEISLSSSTYIFEVKGKKVNRTVIDPKKLGFKKEPIEKIKGGDAKTNAEIIKDVLDGRDGAKKDIVILNSAAALYVAGKVKTFRKGIKEAEESINTGKAKELLRKVINYSRMV